jgi:hypothetical protein
VGPRALGVEQQQKQLLEKEAAARLLELKHYDFRIRSEA